MRQCVNYRIRIRSYQVLRECVLSVCISWICFYTANSWMKFKYHSCIHRRKAQNLTKPEESMQTLISDWACPELVLSIADEQIQIGRPKKQASVSSLEIVDHIVRDGRHSLQSRGIQHKARPWASRLPLQIYSLATRLGFCLLDVVALPALEELLPAARWLHVLDSHV